MLNSIAVDPNRSRAPMEGGRDSVGLWRLNWPGETPSQPLVIGGDGSSGAEFRPVCRAVDTAKSSTYTAPSARLGERDYSICWRLNGEAHLPAKPACPEASSWIPVAHGRRSVAERFLPVAAPKGASVSQPDFMPSRPARLKRRSDFLRVAAARCKAVTPGLVLQARRRDGAGDPIAGPRVGFTASRKVGNAVARNRARRRLRALAEEVLPSQSAPGADYVLIARRALLSRSYDSLRRDLESALARVDHVVRRQA